MCECQKFKDVIQDLVDKKAILFESLMRKGKLSFMLIMKN